MIDKKESVEDYLEHILMLKEKHDIVRAVDLAKFMGFSKASVSIALKKMKDENLLYVEPNGNIILTDEGNRIGEATYERHKVISSLLVRIGVSEETALIDACRVEHVISEETFNKIKESVEKNA